MNIKKIKYFIHLVEKERTGAPKDVAVILEVSERTIYHFVQILKMPFECCIRGYLQISNAFEWFRLKRVQRLLKTHC